ncbi:MAG: FG-GAP-like repeat-containing protein [Victivallales bacterium]
MTSRRLQLLAVFLMVLAAALLPGQANADTTLTIPLLNQTGLPSGDYTVYVLGYSSTSKKALAPLSDGILSFQTVSGTGTGVIPSFKVGTAPGEVQKIEMVFPDSFVPGDPAAVDGARIYLFVAKNTTFTTAPGFYYNTGFAVTQPTNPPNSTFTPDNTNKYPTPPFMYAEFTYVRSSYGWVADVSTVDGFAFPISIGIGGTGSAHHYDTIGQPLDNTDLGREAILDAYTPFMAALAAEGGNNYTAMKYTDVGGDILLNPFYFLTAIDGSNNLINLESPLNRAFDGELNTLFSNGALLTLNGDATASIPSDTYKGATVTRTYPGAIISHKAIEFTGVKTPANKFTVFNPLGFSVPTFLDSGTGKDTPITGTITGTTLTFNPKLPSTTLQTGLFVFGNGIGSPTRITGITLDTGKIASVTLSADLGNPAPDSQYQFCKAPNAGMAITSGAMVFGCTGLLADGSTEADADRQTVLKGLQRDISQALNLGAANNGHNTAYWKTETNWYPAGTPQNLFSLFMHTATLGDPGKPIFTRADNAVKSARGTTMGMAYGFAYDENPPVGPQVPSKWDPLPGGGSSAYTTMTVTLGSWGSSALTFAKADYPTGTGPNCVIAGDFGNNGALDLAVANMTGASVSVLRGTGTGTFGANTDYPTADQAYSVAAGDFDADGNLDLAAANYSNNNISVRMGVGDGTFGANADHDTGTGPISVISGSFTGSPNADLVIADYTGGCVSIILGRDNFTARTDSFIGSGPNSMAKGDFDNDGNPDLAVTNFNDNTVSIMIGNGDGALSGVDAQSAGAGPSSVAAGDFNGDGYLDIAVANSTDNNVSIVLGDGLWFEDLPKTDFPTGNNPRSVTAGDFNADGNLDIAVANYNDNTVSILLGAGDGTLGAKIDFPVGSSPTSATAADFNKDGYLDLAVTNFGSNNVSILLNTTFSSTTKIINDFTIPAQVGSTLIDQLDHTIAVTMPYGTNVTALVPAITIAGVSVTPSSGTAKNFTNPVTYTVTAKDSSTRNYTAGVRFAPNPDIAAVAADKAALTDDSIRGGNPDLADITVSLTTPLPSVGANGSAITWASNKTDVVSNDGQTIHRPSFTSGDATVTLTATITKGVVSDTKAFALTVLALPVSSDKAITSFKILGAGSVNEGAHTVAVTLPFGTNVTNLVPTISVSPSATISPLSGAANNFLKPQKYTVTAEDSSTQDYIVTVASIPATTVSLKNGIAVTGISGASGSVRKYTIVVPDDKQAMLEIMTYGGTGDCDINVSIGAAGSRRYSTRSGTSENIQYENPVPETYYITVFGNAAYSGVTLLARFTTLAPVTPTKLAASKGIFADRVALTWTASSCATSYEVYRALYNGTVKPVFDDADKIATVAVIGHDDTKAEFGGGTTPNIYYYWVKAVNPTGSSKETAAVTGNVMAVPTQPGTVTASDGTYFNKIRVTWTKMANVTSYEILRSENSVFDWLEAVSVGTLDASNLSSYTLDDFEVPAVNKVYYYWVKGLNDVNGLQTLSSKHDGGILSGKGPATVTATRGSVFEKVRVAWSAVSGATAYDIYRDGSLLEADVASPYEDTPGNTDSYKYKILAKYANGGVSYVSAFSPVVSGYAGGDATLAAPLLKSASTNLYDYVLIKWGAVSKAGTYKIYRNPDFTVPGPGPIEVSSLSHIDDNVTPGTQYTYTVTAVAGTESPHSRSMTGMAAALELVNFGDPADYPTGQKISVLDGARGSARYYSIVVPSNTTRLVATVSGATTAADDCDVYAKLGCYPTTASYNAKGVENTTNEVLTVSNPAGGTWYFLLYGAGTAGYTARDFTVACYNAADIYLTTVPVNDMTAPFTATFKGKVVDASGTGIAGLTLMARSPITGISSYLTVKTDAKGAFSYSELIGTEGEHTFDFFFTKMPDSAKGTASHTVFTKNTSLYDSQFDFSAYMKATPVDLNADDTFGMQNFLNTSNGWDDIAVAPDYQTMWIDKTLGVVQTDTALLWKLDAGLYMFLYGVEGAGAGDDTATEAGTSGLTPLSGLSSVPFVVHVGDAAVLDTLHTMLIIDDTTWAEISGGAVGVVAIASFPVDTNKNVSLSAAEELILLSNIAGNNVVVLPDVGGRKQFEVTVDAISGRKINVVTSSFYMPGN